MSGWAGPLGCLAALALLALAAAAIAHGVDWWRARCDLTASRGLWDDLDLYGDPT